MQGSSANVRLGGNTRWNEQLEDVASLGKHKGQYLPLYAIIIAINNSGIQANPRLQIKMMGIIIKLPNKGISLGFKSYILGIIQIRSFKIL